MVKVKCVDSKDKSHSVLMQAPSFMVNPRVGDAVLVGESELFIEKITHTETLEGRSHGVFIPKEPLLIVYLTKQLIK